MKTSLARYLVVGSILSAAFGLNACSSDSGSSNDPAGPGISDSLPDPDNSEIVNPQPEPGIPDVNQGTLEDENTEPLPSEPEADPGFFVDARDGQNYKTTTIGTQVWMAENLSVRIEGSDCFSMMGGCASSIFYTWAAAEIACPSGWHLPTVEEWKLLERFIVSSGYVPAGEALRSDYNEDWISGRGENPFGFNAKADGRFGFAYGSRDGVGSSAYFWASPNHYLVIHSDGRIVNDIAPESYGLSIRCVKN